MKSLLILLAVVATTFAWPSEEWAEWNSPNRMQYGAPWEINKNIDTNMEATEQSRRTKSRTARRPRTPCQEVFEPGHIYLMLGNNNLFLSSINNAGQVFLQSIKTQQDEFCRFAVSVLNNGKVAFRDFAGQGLYLQLNPGGGANSIRPTSAVIDDSAQFEVQESGPGPWKGAHYVYLRAANGNYTGIVGFPVENNIAADYIGAVEATRLIVLEAL